MTAIERVVSAAGSVGAVGAVGEVGEVGEADGPLAREADNGDAIDRLAALYQWARLWKRRTLRLLAVAVATGDTLGIRAARARYRRASHWEMMLYEHYVRAVLAEYC